MPRALDPPDPRQPSWGGPIEVRISKFDGQIVDYMHTIIPE
jgi:hypothetical protein